MTYTSVLQLSPTCGTVPVIITLVDDPLKLVSRWGRCSVHLRSDSFPARLCGLQFCILCALEPEEQQASMERWRVAGLSTWYYAAMRAHPQMDYGSALIADQTWPRQARRTRDTPRHDTLDWQSLRASDAAPYM